MKDIRENIHEYIRVQNYLLDYYQVDKIHEIKLFKSYVDDSGKSTRAHITRILESNEDSFTYEFPKYFMVDLTTDRYLSFIREYEINNILSSCTLSNIDDLVSKYMNNLHDIENGYSYALYKYIHSLDNGSQVRYMDSPYIKHKSNDDNKGRTTIKCIKSGKLIKNVPYDSLRPR